MVEPLMFACKPHWFMLPKDIRSEIWSAFERRLGPGGVERHARAKQAAVDWWTRRIAERPAVAEKPVTQATLDAMPRQNRSIDQPGLWG